MAIFKPEIKEGSFNKFYGICELEIEKFEDKTDNFAWADIFIDVIVNQKGSDYTRNVKIDGSFDKASQGNITGGSVLKRMYKFFEVIGCTAGLTIKGEWETEDGTSIQNIGNYLNENFVNPIMPDNHVYDYIGYVYKEKPKTQGDKAWTRVYPKIYSNTDENKAKLKDDIDWLKGKGYLKEFTDEPTNSSGGNLEATAI